MEAGGIHCDLKAYYCISTELLHLKVNYGIGGIAGQWFKLYLHDTKLHRNKIIRFQV